MLHEMDYTLMRTAPAYGESAATGRGYSTMAYMASSVAHFIRDLGYEAIPSGNDTALSIPMAVDAGLGELGRHGLLIAPRFGPRVRISKVLTNLPLVADKPIEIGVREMCAVCGKCARVCPGPSVLTNPPRRGSRYPITTGFTNGISILKNAFNSGCAIMEIVQTASGSVCSINGTHGQIAL